MIHLLSRFKRVQELGLCNFFILIKWSHNICFSISYNAWRLLLQCDMKNLDRIYNINIGNIKSCLFSRHYPIIRITFTH